MVFHVAHAFFWWLRLQPAVSESFGFSWVYWELHLTWGQPHPPCVQFDIKPDAAFKRDYVAEALLDLHESMLWSKVITCGTSDPSNLV